MHWTLYPTILTNITKKLKRKKLTKKHVLNLKIKNIVRKSNHNAKFMPPPRIETGISHVQDECMKHCVMGTGKLKNKQAALKNKQKNTLIDR